MKTILRYSLLLVVLLAFGSCKDMLDIKPVHSMMPKSLEDYEAVLLGGYPRTDFFIKTEMLTDNIYANLNAEVQPTQENERWFTFAPSLLPPESLVDPYWGQLYKSIYYANTVLDNLKKLEVTPLQQQLFEQVQGEAYALRAFSYFYLINFYADVYDVKNLNAPGVPMPLTADDVNANAGNNVRTPIGDVWNQIVADIDKASQLLSGKKITDRYRFSSNTLELFRARVDLMMGNYESAIAHAKTVIDFYPLADLSGLEKRLAESGAKNVLTYIYGFVDTQANKELLFFTGGRAGTNPYYYATGSMKPSLDLLTLTKRYGELTDYRQFIFDPFEENAVQAIKTGKTVYKMYASQDLIWYYVGFKASEAYLIRAEAQARLGKDELALKDINQILASRMRKDFVVTLKATDFANNAAVLDRILAERRLELGLDAGLRFMDLRRLGKPEIQHVFKDARVYTLAKDDSRYLMQIPPSESENSPNMPLNPR
ncbi:RagB/SusD family nutrient uptake outer membrane protein [Sphingobacterium psychroaquaticum]|uniref:RagB/SusD family nutrient uptake outer membrane protein n=1 Tax=Sphingobacterium psychroaquaticum TaxID=561061 RepID=UPI00106A0A14|nr:RagB/SusD family nutrient uptake outer membrane protein [Sphingobacterium psychroaquaticum]QBQ39954.1 RagB/SusD family nutrient uptake outer membrane protein [Sphingobacterium psychroaquaticum]